MLARWIPAFAGTMWGREVSKVCRVTPAQAGVHCVSTSPPRKRRSTGGAVDSRLRGNDVGWGVFVGAAKSPLRRRGSTV